MPIPPHILIIDADSGAARVTRTLVEHVDSQATFAIESSADRGRASAHTHPPDIIIIDPSPYNPADEQLIRDIKQEYPDVRIIILTSAPNLAFRRRMVQIGADLYIEKLSATPSLIDGLRQMLQKTPSA